LVKPIYLFGVDAHIQNLVGPETYGVYFALFNLVFLFQFIVEPGIQSFNSRNIAINPNHLGLHLPRILGIKLVLFLIFMVVVYVGFHLWGYSTDLLPLVSLIGVNLFLSTTFIYLRSNIAAIGKYRIDSFLSSLDKVLMLLILGVLSWAPSFRDNFTIIWLVYGQLAAYLISCLVAVIILWNHLKGFTIVFSWEYFTNLIRWSFPFILVLLFMSIYNKMDGIMLERMIDDNGRQAGIYAAGYRFVDALNMIGYMFAALLLPMYSSNLKNKEVLKDLLYTGLKALGVISIIAMMSMIVYGPEIMNIIYDDADSYYFSVLTYLMISFLGVSIAYIYGAILTATNNLKSLNILFFCGVLANLGLNLYLIPRMKAEGAAIATLITQAVVMVGQIVLVHKQANIKIDPKIYTKIVVFGLLCALLFIELHEIMGLSWYYELILSICISMILALVLKIIDLKNLLKLINDRKA